jgi:hypothetical protein
MMGTGRQYLAIMSITCNSFHLSVAFYFHLSFTDDLPVSFS